jgi:FkbM family methyltransferase
MAKIFKEFVRRTALRNKQNLQALDDVYLTIKDLMKGQSVTGILDAGASNGRVSRKLLRYFPLATVYGFEPNRAYEDDWKALTTEDDRYRIAHMALADEAGELELNITRSAGPSSFFKPNAKFTESHPEAAAIDHVEKVPIVRLDDWRAEQGNPPIQLMKFDIQAAELKAMKGAVETLKDTRLIYTEIFFNPMYEGGAIYSEIDLFLRSQGFNLYNIYKPRADETGMLDQANAIFIRQ